MILDVFDHAFIINEDSETGRMVSAKQKLTEVNIMAERIAAVKPKERGSYRSIGQRGCVESHLKAIKLARYRGYRNVLIFEDDIIFRSGFSYYWDQVTDDVHSTDYDLFYFYRWREAGRNNGAITVVPIAGTLCAHAYAVNGYFFDQFIRIVEDSLDSGNGLPIDRVFSSANARLFALSYNLIGQDAGISTITGNVKEIRFEDRFESD